jgi:hypothetical protein
MIKIETGKSPPKTQLIKNPQSAEKIYEEMLESAKEEVMIVTSSKGLSKLFKDKTRLEKWTKKGISLRIMAPIMNENLAVAQELLKWGEVRHIPLGYFHTTIIDGRHLFQFRNDPDKKLQTTKKKNFENTFYTNDFWYIKQTKDMFHDLWKKTRIPSSVQLESILFLDSKNETHKCLRRVWSQKELGMVFSSKKLTEKDVLKKFTDAKRNAPKNWSNTHWSDTMCFLGPRAFATIHPPDHFKLPDMTFVILQDDETSTFGAENMLKVFIKSDNQHHETYQLVAHVQDNPKSMSFRKAKLAGFPGRENIILVNKNQLNIRLHGNTFFAGWTIPVPLLPTKYVLPPSCILFEGYGKVRSGMFCNFLPSKRKNDIYYNNLEAFVTFFHPSSKYIGPGTEGSIDRESVQITYPSQ